MRGNKVVKLRDIAEAALSIAAGQGHTVTHTLVIDRLGPARLPPPPPPPASSGRQVRAGWAASRLVLSLLLSTARS